ncbi:MAG: hypothetical protein ACJ79S_00140 [Gemmatimonadaceae bacterium]
MSAADALTVACLTDRGGRGDRSVLSRQLAGIATVEWFADACALVSRAEAGGLSAIVTGLEDGSGHAIAPLLVALAARAPATPTVVYAPVNGATVRKLLATAAEGMRVEYAVRPHEPLAPVLRRVVRPSFRPGVAPLLLRRFAACAPAPLRVFVTIAAITAPSRRCAGEIARWSGVTLRTIERRLHRARWPGAHVVVQSFAALDAAWLMMEYGWSARLVRRERALPHESSVTRLLARYCASRPLTLREDGGFPAALEHVTRVLAPRHDP